MTVQTYAENRWRRNYPAVIFPPHGCHASCRAMARAIDYSDEVWFVYRLWAGYTLLYVGYTARHPAKRLKEHSKQKPWWPRVEWMTIAGYFTEGLAVAEERRAIAAENPLYNITGRVQA